MTRRHSPPSGLGKLYPADFFVAADRELEALGSQAGDSLPMLPPAIAYPKYLKRWQIACLRWVAPSRLVTMAYLPLRIWNERVRQGRDRTALPPIDSGARIAFNRRFLAEVLCFLMVTRSPGGFMREVAGPRVIDTMSGPLLPPLAGLSQEDHAYQNETHKFCVGSGNRCTCAACAILIARLALHDGDHFDRDSFA